MIGKYIKTMLDTDGKLPKRDSYGYELIYIVFGPRNIETQLCAECANKAKDNDKVTVQRITINYEGPEMACIECGHLFFAQYNFEEEINA